MTSHEFYITRLEPNIERIEKMREFKRYRRTKIAEMGELTSTEVSYVDVVALLEGKGISISDEDKKLPLGEFLSGKIARNPENHKDQWYVAKKYFEDNFELEN